MSDFRRNVVKRDKSIIFLREGIFMHNFYMTLLVEQYFLRSYRPDIHIRVHSRPIPQSQNPCLENLPYFMFPKMTITELSRRYLFFKGIDVWLIADLNISSNAYFYKRSIAGIVSLAAPVKIDLIIHEGYWGKEVMMVRIENVQISFPVHISSACMRVQLYPLILLIDFALGESRMCKLPKILRNGCSFVSHVRNNYMSINAN